MVFVGWQVRLPHPCGKSSPVLYHFHFPSARAASSAGVLTHQKWKKTSLLIPKSTEIYTFSKEPIMSSGIYSSNFGRGVTWDAKKKTPQGGSWQMKVFVGPDPRASRWGSIPRFHRKKLDLVSPSWFLFGDVESLHLHPKETKDIPNISKEKSSFEPTKFGGKKLCVKYVFLTWRFKSWWSGTCFGILQDCIENQDFSHKLTSNPKSQPQKKIKNKYINHHKKK